VAPVLDLVETFAHLNEELRWGYQLPYAITGYHNVHPRAGMDKMAGEDRHQVRAMHEALSRRRAARIRGVG
ncbi:MAG: hypothetical protein VX265_06390, partial [Myxococcota bacterium]|nr:hypothetical protein [Myxococcota bacterium]